MISIQDIDNAIATDGFKESTLSIINKLINDIENGSTDIPRFNQQEHSGLCKAGQALIGASIVSSYATRSLAASGDASSSQGCAANWQIDERQEQFIEKWAKAAHLWVESSDSVLREGFGPMIAQGAEAKVYFGQDCTRRYAPCQCFY